MTKILIEKRKNTHTHTYRYNHLIRSFSGVFNKRNSSSSKRIRLSFNNNNSRND
jgi:hypothetical protein